MMKHIIAAAKTLKLKRLLLLPLCQVYRYFFENSDVTVLWSFYNRLPLDQFLKRMKITPHREVAKLHACPVTDPNIFFNGKPRTDSDFAEVWYLWAKDKGYDVYRVLVMDSRDRKSARLACLWFNRSGWHLGYSQNYIGWYPIETAVFNGIREFPGPFKGIPIEYLQWTKL